KLQWVGVKEHRRVVADDVPVTFFGVELHGEPANVADRIGRAPFAGDDREPHEHLGLLADFGEQLCAGVAGDVVAYGESAIRARTLGMHATFWDELAVEGRELF